MRPKALKKERGMSDERLEFLSRLPLWTGLSYELLKQVAAAMKPMRFEAGAFIIRQGEPGSCLHVLCSGLAEARVRTEGGASVGVATFVEGDSFGEMSLLTGDPTSADVAAIEESETLALGREEFSALVQTYPNLLRELLRTISRRLAATNVAVGVAWEMERDLERFLHEQKTEQYGALDESYRGKELDRQIEECAGKDAPLLIQAERGTGKELVARLIHQRSARKDGPFLSADCTQIGETSLGDKLFGIHDPENGGPSHSRAVCYMDLAEGGAILLKNIEALPAAVQERLGRFLCAEPDNPDVARHNVRVIATHRGDLTEETMSSRLSPALVKALSGHVLALRPLRERKREIPELARHFMRKHARRLGRKVESLDDQAIIKLVSYDYPIANVQELEDAIERAVILTDRDTIGAEEVFLGPPHTSRPGGFNLLALPERAVRPALRLYPTMVWGLTAAIFAFILYECFFGSEAGGNWGTLLVWSVWWPMLVLSFFLIGRAWCAICPMALAGMGAQRLWHLERRIPAWLKKNDFYVVMVGFFAIVWVEEVTGMKYAPRATGVLLLVILAGALTASVLFPRRTWCRHLCPLGGFAGLCSTSAPLELRPSVDICAGKCKDHACYKGSERKTGCPMFQHVMFMDSNRDCVLCMNCVRSCPNSSPRLNLRVPARELWTGLTARPEVGRFVAVLLGLLVAQALIHDWESGAYGVGTRLLEQHRFLFLTTLMLLSAAIPLLVLWPVARWINASPDPGAPTRFWKKLTAFVPLLTGGYVGHQLGNVPGLGSLQVVFQYHTLRNGVPFAWPVSLLSTAQFAILSVGLAVTLAVLWKITRDEEKNKEKQWNRELAVSFAGAVAYWAMVVAVMVVPNWLLA